MVGLTAWTNSGALPVAVLMAFSGHKSMRMLMRYTHLQPVRLAVKLATLMAPVQGPPLVK